MNSPIWHIIKKDLRRFRALLAVWCVALATRVVAPGFAEAGVERPLEVSLVLMAVLILFLNALMVTRVLAEDSPLKEAAFWRSRPIAGRQMMTAKLLFLAWWTLVVPLVVIAVAGAATGFTTRELIAVAAGQLMLHAVVSVFFVTTAILTQRVWAAVVGVIVVFVAMQIAQRPQIAPEAASDFENTSGMLSCVSVAAAVGLIALGIASAQVYRDRRRMAAGAVLAAGAAGVWLAGEFWRADFLRWVPAFERLEPRSDSQARMVMTPLKNNSTWSSSGASYRQLQAAVDWEGLAPGEVRVPYRVEGDLTWGDGSTLSRALPVGLQRPYDLGPALRGLGMENVRTHERGSSTNPMTFVDIIEEEVHRLRDGSPTWKGKVFARVGRMEVHARVALKAGAGTKAGAYRVRVLAVEEKRGKVEVQIVEREPHLPQWSDAALGTLHDGFLRDKYALINARKKEAMLPLGGSNRGETRDGFSRYGESKLEFSSTTDGTAYASEELAQWLADAELVKFRFNEERRVVAEALLDLKETY